MNTTEPITEPDDTEQFDVVLEDDEGNIRPRKLKQKDAKRKFRGNGWEYVGLAGQIGFDIALPMAAGLLVGTKLDSVWGTRPVATLVLFTVGLLLGCASLIRIVRESMRKA